MLFVWDQSNTRLDDRCFLDLYDKRGRYLPPLSQHSAKLVCLRGDVRHKTMSCTQGLYKTIIFNSLTVLANPFPGLRYYTLP